MILSQPSNIFFAKCGCRFIPTPLSFSNPVRCVFVTPVAVSPHPLPPSRTFSHLLSALRFVVFGFTKNVDQLSLAAPVRFFPSPSISYIICALAYLTLSLARNIPTTMGCTQSTLPSAHPKHRRPRPSTPPTARLSQPFNPYTPTHPKRFRLRCVSCDKKYKVPPRRFAGRKPPVGDWLCAYCELQDFIRQDGERF